MSHQTAKAVWGPPYHRLGPESAKGGIPFKPVSHKSGADSNAFWGNPAMTAFSGAARIRVTVLRGGILDLGICLTSD